jgi:hypothetical protein
VSRRSRRSGKSKRSRTWLYIAVPALAVVLAVVGGRLIAGGGDGRSTKVNVELAPVAKLPARVKQAPPVVREAYRFAVANPEVLSSVPCYCGCGAMGHQSNLDCFIEEMREDGSIVWGYHALG